MAEFCDITMPGYDNRKGYINVAAKSERLGIDRRTFYGWKKAESAPTLQKLLDLLNDRGYTLEVVPWKGMYDNQDI